MADVLNIQPASLQKIAKLQSNGAEYAKEAHLTYVNDLQPGIKRLKKGRGFIYLLDDKKINDKAELQRIRNLVIPPAWKNVWICKLHNGHLQATGLDSKN